MDNAPSPDGFHHGRVLGLVLAIVAPATIIVDLLFDHGLNRWTLVKIGGTCALILAYFYLWWLPKRRRK